MKKLTIKEEKFANLYLELGDKTEALRRSYDCSNMSDKTIWTMASKLSNSPKVSTRIDALRKEMQLEHAIDRNWILNKHLTTINTFSYLLELAMQENLSKEDLRKINLLKDTVKGSDYRGALESISRMLGLYEPEKVEMTTVFKADFG